MLFFSSLIQSNDRNSNVYSIEKLTVCLGFMLVTNTLPEASEIYVYGQLNLASISNV